MRNRLSTISIIINSLGSLLIILAVILLLPLIVAFINGEPSSGMSSWWAFLIPSGIALFIGLLFYFLVPKGTPYTRAAILICSLAWIAFSAIGALPFVFCLKTGYLDAFFETMSGFTTTGITIFRGLDTMPRSIIFWRALIQWIGGLGILTLFLAVLSGKGEAHRLFGAESHKVDAERPVPGLSSTVKILWAIYIGFTLFIITLLMFAGVRLFDGICHGMTAIATGGFSPYDASIGVYKLSGHPNYIYIEYIIILGMILGGTNFLIHFRVLKGDIKALIDNSEMRYWWTIILSFVAVIAIERFFSGAVPPPVDSTPGGYAVWFEENLRASLFHTVSIITTTGFVTEDIGGMFFGSAAKLLFLVMMVIGGCVGSTGGGFKVFRISILAKLIKREVFRLRAPERSVAPLVVDGKVVNPLEIYRACGIFFAWIVLIVAGGCITSLFSDLDAGSAFSGMCSALGNIGPCYISVDQMISLNPVVKITYIVGMLAGRLEILPVLLLFSRRAWM
ncbi:MAG: TrkH family potassium uptake protein [Spirochaetales bacterium]|nr:TrkH family potassium uptake protein [Spirochaetales bacterium]